MTTNETTNQAKNLIDPYVRATKAWVAEVEKFQQTTIENMTRAVDESYKIAKESINNIASIHSNFRKQWETQMARANEFMTSFVP